MTHYAWEDLDNFLSLDEFAIKAEVRLQNGRTFSIAALFDDPYLNADLGEYEMDNSDPRLTCRFSDVIEVEQGDVAVVDGVEYDILTSPQSDGTGLAIIKMSVKYDQRTY